MTSPSFRPSVFPAAGEEKLADEARDERRARHDGAPKVAESFLVFYAINFVVYFFSGKSRSPDLQLLPTKMRLTSYSSTSKCNYDGNYL